MAPANEFGDDEGVGEAEVHDLEVETAARPRVDQYVAAQPLGLSRSQVRRLIEAGLVEVNGEECEPATRLSIGDQVRVEVPPPEDVELVAEAMDLSVLYEDEHVIVLDKPAGLVVHPAPGHPSGTLVNGLLAHCKDLSGVGGERRPGIVHRLDKDTSGVMVATKSDAAHQGLAAGFADKSHEREYVAVVAPAPGPSRLTVDTLYGRHPTARKKFSSQVSRGKRAVTHIEVVERFDAGAALVACRLETGRTHQIRVHCADSGFPVLGDPVYARRRGGVLGELAAELGRQALHARLLCFEHPVTGEEIRCEAPIPPDMQRVIDALRAR